MSAREKWGAPVYRARTPPYAVAGIAFIAAVVAMPLKAFAYVPPSWFIVKKMAERIGKVESFVARGSVRFPGRDGVFPRVMLFQAPSMVRVETTLPDGPRIEVWDGTRRLVKAETGGIDEKAGPEIPVGALFGTVDPWATLKERGLASKVGMVHERGRAMYVIGDRERGKLQLWVERDSFLPARIATESGELRFVDYDLTITGGKFPRVLETLVDGARAESFAIETFETNVSVAAKAFDRESLNRTAR